MSVLDRIEEEIESAGDSISEEVGSAGESISEEVGGAGERLLDESQEAFGGKAGLGLAIAGPLGAGIGTTMEMRDAQEEVVEAKERERQRQQELIKKRKEKARKQRRQRKSKLMSALEGEGGPDLFSLLGTEQGAL